MEAMPTVSSSVEKLPQIPHISLTQRHQTIRHPEKCSKPENDAICGLSRLPALVSRTSLSRSWMRLLVFLQHLDELLNSVRASIGFLGGLNSEEDGSFVCLEYNT